MPTIVKIEKYIFYLHELHTHTPHTNYVVQYPIQPTTSNIPKFHLIIKIIILRICISAEIAIYLSGCNLPQSPPLPKIPFYNFKQNANRYSNLSVEIFFIFTFCKPCVQFLSLLLSSYSLTATVFRSFVFVLSLYIAFKMLCIFHYVLYA